MLRNGINCIPVAIAGDIWDDRLQRNPIAKRLTCCLETHLNPLPNRYVAPMMQSNPGYSYEERAKYLHTLCSSKRARLRHPDLANQRGAKPLHDLCCLNRKPVPPFAQADVRVTWRQCSLIKIMSIAFLHDPLNTVQSADYLKTTPNELNSENAS